MKSMTRIDVDLTEGNSQDQRTDVQAAAEQNHQVSDWMQIFNESVQDDSRLCTLVTVSLMISQGKEEFRLEHANFALHSTLLLLQTFMILYFCYMFYLEFYLLHPCFIQALLRDTESSVPDHCNKANITIKQVTGIFGFPVPINLTFKLHCVVS